MDKKIIALDLDGTLLNSDGIVTEATKKTFKKIKRRGSYNYNSNWQNIKQSTCWNRWFRICKLCYL